MILAMKLTEAFCSGDDAFKLVMATAFWLNSSSTCKGVIILVALEGFLVFFTPFRVFAGEGNVMS